MDAVFVDINGNKKNFLYQYDKGQYLVVEDFEYSVAPKVQFQIKTLDAAMSVSSVISDGSLRASIPNSLLTYGEDITAFIYIEDEELGYVVETIFISVTPRKKPANYTYTSEMFARTINGTTMSNNFGYADVFELSDKNDNVNEYFVTITDGQTVSKASSINDVYGVAVTNPGFVSNCSDDKLDSSGNLLPQHIYVCSFGFASVIDNGSCTIGDMCVPAIDGTATPSDDGIGYKVIDRIDDSHVFIFVDINVISHTNNKDNPHDVTKAQIGLGNVDNTSDKDKPISTATQAALDTKATLVDGKISKDVLPDDIGVNIVVETIADRDALDAFEGLLVHVKDASADTSVSSTSADYIYDGSEWVLISGSSSGGSSDFVMTDTTTGGQYTLGMDNGKLVVIPVGEVIDQIADGDIVTY